MDASNVRTLITHAGASFAWTDTWLRNKKGNAASLALDLLPLYALKNILVLITSFLPMLVVAWNY